MSVKVTLALEVTYKPGTELWENLKLVLADSKAEWDVRPQHKDDQKYDRHTYDEKQKESNLQVVSALFAHKIGKGTQCDFLASVRYRLTLANSRPDGEPKPFNRNLVKLFGFNGFCAIFQMKTTSSAKVDPDVLPRQNVAVMIRSGAKEKYQDISDDALDLIWQKIDSKEGVFNALTLVGPADDPSVVDPARTHSPVADRGDENAVKDDATLLVVDADSMQCRSSTEDDEDALAANVNLHRHLSSYDELDVTASTSAAVDPVRAKSKFPQRLWDDSWTREISVRTAGGGTLILLFLASVAYLPHLSLLHSQVSHEPSQEITAVSPQMLPSQANIIAMEQVDLYDSTMLLSNGPFEGFRAADDILNSPLAAQAPWLKGLPAKHRLEFAHRYAAAFRVADAKPRLLPEKQRPRAIRCEYQYNALIAVIVSGSFTEGTGHSPSHYYHAVIDTRSSSREVPLILREPKDEIEGSHFNIAAIVFPFDLDTPADAFLAIELLP